MLIETYNVGEELELSQRCFFIKAAKVSMLINIKACYFLSNHATFFHSLFQESLIR